MINLVPFKEEYTEAMRIIWNEIISEGGNVPFLNPFSEEEFRTFVQSETLITVAKDGDRVVGMYMIHPNVPGRCASIANADYSVDVEYRGRHIGEMLVTDSLTKAKELGFRLMQFNGVVDSNVHARHLYERCGFVHVGVIPKGFQVKDGHYEDMHIYYHIL